MLAALSHAGEGCGWERAVGVVVDEVLPRPAVRTYGAAGRPGADRTRVPDDVRRRAEAERLLRAALGAWEDGR